MPQYFFIRTLPVRCIIMPSQVIVRTGPILSCFLHQTFFSLSSVPQGTSYFSSLTWVHNNICYGEKVIKLLTTYSQSNGYLLRLLYKGSSQAPSFYVVLLRKRTIFDVLLTVYLSIILVINQRNAQKRVL